MNTRSGGRRKKQAKFFGLPSEKLHYGRTKPKRVKDFSCKSRDGRELKIYIGTGCVPSDFGINELMMKFPQFTVYDKVSLGSAFNRLKRQANSLSFERKNKKNGKLYTILYIKLLLSIFIIIKNFIFLKNQLLAFLHIQIMMKLMTVTTKMMGLIWMTIFRSFVIRSQESPNLMQELLQSLTVVTTIKMQAS